MSFMTRSFTSREKLLLVILGALIVGSVYYLLFFQPVSSSLEQSKANTESLESQLVVLDAKVKAIKNMQKSMEEFKENGHVESIMPSYSAGKQELNFLNTTLANSEDYYVGFTKITREGNQIRRDFAMKFTVPHYTEAEDIINNLEHSDLRCLISDFDVKPVEKDETIGTGEVEVSCVATFYETMYGGVADAELPPDSKKEEEEVVGTYEYEEGSLAK